MAGLHLDARIACPDGLFEELVLLLEEFPEERRSVVQARLIFLLANHIGDDAVVHEAIGLARGTPRSSENGEAD